MPSLFEAYVTNAGKYAEGHLVGETLKFPTATEEVQALLKRIGVDGIRYEKIFITAFDGDVLGLHEHLGEYERASPRGTRFFRLQSGGFWKNIRATTTTATGAW